jgi:hypothetical protein
MPSHEVDGAYESRVSWAQTGDGPADLTKAEHVVFALCPHSTDQRSCFASSSRDGASN